ncbi:amidase family protein [Kineococcus gypseus]|uniref:amidase family protein n=1 Tax=Kineococcus gypseus TaxID=1637102 RepID=UPI003D7DF7BF
MTLEPPRHPPAAPAGPDAPDGPAAPSATWRVPPAGEPLVRGRAGGPLTGVRVAVKDVLAVAGHRTGAGVPTWCERAAVQPRHAAALQFLLDAGADVVGIAQTDELAFSLMGANAHHGTPPNPAAPGHLPGGSTSGPASAVAAGRADVGLGTDTAGSLRVPASWCGLHALRPTHGAVPTAGVLPLAPSFDTVGVLARDAAHLRAAAGALLPAGAAPRPAALLHLPALTALAGPATARAVEAAARDLARRTGLPLRELDEPVAPADAAAWTAAFRTVQAAEAWRAHGGFVEAHPGALSAPVAARFRAGRDVGAHEEAAARAVLAARREWLAGLLAGDGDEAGLLCLPATAGPAPRADAAAGELEAARAATLTLTSLGSLAGVPVLALPAPRVGALPVGLAVAAPAGADRALLELLPADPR